MGVTVGGTSVAMAVGPGAARVTVATGTRGAVGEIKGATGEIKGAVGEIKGAVGETSGAGSAAVGELIGPTGGGVEVAGVEVQAARQSVRDKSSRIFIGEMAG